jgi:diaminohydroxyphosphoribosylaminopyrimidine deaminase/5-amino-6-(5-phosphoribosylamino)uracil reductase
MVRTAREVPLWAATAAAQDHPARAALASAGVEFIACETHDGRIALPELLEDLAARGLSSVFVEGGEQAAQAFLAEGLVDRLILLTGEMDIEGDAVDAPFAPGSVPPGFRKISSMTFGADHMDEFERL